ncbi:hypothetical protein BP5796_02045 [Coleophoma crateriformis]|uniref:Elongation of fatty acids protein n=1 Tax=Coleophoma crateriformis TaxID=565419 RepID=A0A3D8T2J0_9HELO|nr:hypothetical protein BP5796_02045 [Coleophoma crateriformis]
MASISSSSRPLWAAFNTLSGFIAPSPASEFAFIPGNTPMSTFKQTAIAMVAYYIVILGGRELMRNRPAFKLNTLFMAHNLGLTIISGGLLTLFLEQLVPTLWERGVYHSVCYKEAGWTQPLVMLYYLNYLTKYLEFVDTCFLVLRKKPLTFLHTYHHGATALLCYVQLSGETPVSWVPIVLNISVHCLMYWYYFQAARGVKIWWKQYITIMQIVQFVIDLGFVYYLSYSILVLKYLPFLPARERCDGSDMGAFSGVAILTSYLFLFIGFYFATYKKSGKSANRISSAVGAANMRHVSDASRSAVGTLKRVNKKFASTIMTDKA